jgi:hypothetical protein
MIITEDYCSFEVAKLLKEKGFDEPVYHSINKTYRDDRDDVSIWTSDRPENHNNIPEEKNHFCTYSCPTIQMAMKWLREKGIIITVVYMRYSLQTIGAQLMFGFNIQNVQGELLFENIDVAYDSYEQAEMDAIKYSLENLI